MKNLNFFSLCLGLIFALSSFTYSSFSEQGKPCWTTQKFSITNNGSCDVFGTWGNQSFWIGPGSTYNYSLNGNFVEVCVTQSECAVDVVVNYTMLQYCGKYGKPFSVSEICSSSQTYSTVGCKTFSCFSPG